MRRLVLWTATTLLTGSLCISGTHAQNADDDFFPPGPGSGSVGSVDDLPADDDDLEDWWPAMVPESPYEGPLGQVDNREPHDACENCFTIPGIFDYEIFESVPIDDEESEHLIVREIANPAPLEEGEIRPTHDGDEPLWYIGRQAYSGPQDTGPVSAVYDRPIIELKRIRARNTERILSLSGVHGFGLISTGFGVWVLPGSDTTAIPTTIEGVPVQIFVQKRPTFQGHPSTRFRPVPAGARISSSNAGGRITIANGTVGPHIVMMDDGCCQVWSLTAAHVVREYLDDPLPTNGSIRVYQPTVQTTNLFGYVAHVFRLTSCGTPSDTTDCYGPGAITNDTMVNPDIAAIDPIPYGVKVAVGYNTPTGTHPTRHLQWSATGYTNGPSGIARNPRPGDRLDTYGAYSGKLTGRVFGTGLVVVPTDITSTGNMLYRYCCLTGVSAPTKAGDSGAIVTHRGTGSRHVAGVHVVGDGTSAWSIPSQHIAAAFSAISKRFHHYWGTKSAYRLPATRACDLPDDC